MMFSLDVPAPLPGRAVALMLLAAMLADQVVRSALRGVERSFGMFFVRESGLDRQSPTPEPAAAAAPARAAAPELLDGRVWVKRYGSGKCILGATADAEHQPAVRAALAAAAQVTIAFDRDRFGESLEASGVPVDAARRILATVTLDDEVYLQDVWPGC